MIIFIYSLLSSYYLVISIQKKLKSGTQSHRNKIIQYEKMTKEHNETQTRQILKKKKNKENKKVWSKIDW